MIDKTFINGKDFSVMIKNGAFNLKTHIDEVNELNVFPIPDGDTGDNMFSTMLGGVNAISNNDTNLSSVTSEISNGMVLRARGNSGVILSQFFSGMAETFKDASKSDSLLLKKSLIAGTKKAYSAVMTPTEGTMLTVMREGSEYVNDQNLQTPLSVLECFSKIAKKSLEKTPEKLFVLKEAGVIDSGGAGFIYIIDGMIDSLKGISYSDDININSSHKNIDYNLFNENSVLEFGYCVEILLRLQNSKFDIHTFDEREFSETLSEMGNSVVAFKKESLLKIHVHTFYPHKIFEFSQKFGEFLEVKVENMSLQHNNRIIEKENSPISDNKNTNNNKNRKKQGIVAVCNGDGIKNLFYERGIDIIVDGGQTMNPSTDDFLNAFKKINAETIFVFPNNSNIILTAKLAASMYIDSKIEVIESRTIGEGYSALAMFDTTISDANAQKENFTLAMDSVLTCYISQATKSTKEVNAGEYIGFIDKEIITVNGTSYDAALSSLDKINLSTKEICIIIYGKNVPEKEVIDIKNAIINKYPNQEIYLVNGMQDIYDYIFIIE